MRKEGVGRLRNVNSPKKVLQAAVKPLCKSAPIAKKAIKRTARPTPAKVAPKKHNSTSDELISDHPLGYRLDRAIGLSLNLKERRPDHPLGDKQFHKTCDNENLTLQGSQDDN